MKMPRTHPWGWPGQSVLLALRCALNRYWQRLPETQHSRASCHGGALATMSLFSTFPDWLRLSETEPAYYGCAPSVAAAPQT